MWGPPPHVLGQATWCRGGQDRTVELSTGRWIVFGEIGGTWSPEQGGYDRSRTWENVYDDGSRAERLAYRSDLLHLDECGPPREDRYVL